MRVGVKANEPPARLIPTIVFHGDKDPIVHPRNGEAVAVRAMGRSNDLQQTTEHGQAAGAVPMSASPIPIRGTDDV